MEHKEININRLAKTNHGYATYMPIFKFWATFGGYGPLNLKKLAHTEDLLSQSLS